MMAMCVLPVDIADDEKIVRVIKTPYHVKTNKKLKHQAFRPKQGTDDVSVIRQSYMGTNFCKVKAKEIPPVDSYAGLAVIQAQGIRATGSEVHDSRSEYYGHAHISHGFILQPDEPLAPAKNLLMNERCRALCAVTLYYSDPAPHTEDWTGPTI